MGKEFETIKLRKLCEYLGQWSLGFDQESRMKKALQKAVRAINDFLSDMQDSDYRNKLAKCLKEIAVCVPVNEWPVFSQPNIVSLTDWEVLTTIESLIANAPPLNSSNVVIERGVVIADSSSTVKNITQQGTPGGGLTVIATNNSSVKNVTQRIGDK
jgi:hypothetical protein